jgi:hypothetical protein
VIAQWILLLLGGLFLCAGLIDLGRERRATPRSRAWLLVGVIFLVVTAVLRYQQIAQ